MRTSVINPFESNKGVATAPIPSPPIKIYGGSSHGSPGFATGIEIIPPLESVII